MVTQRVLYVQSYHVIRFHIRITPVVSIAALGSLVMAGPRAFLESLNPMVIFYTSDLTDHPGSFLDDFVENQVKQCTRIISKHWSYLTLILKNG